MKLKRVGFFSDLRYGEPSERRIADCVRDICTEDQGKYSVYLSSGRMIIASPGFSRDIFSPDKIIGPLSMLTDGVYIWPSDLAYYVRSYNVQLPEHFIAHGDELGWMIPEFEISNIEI